MARDFEDFREDLDDLFEDCLVKIEIVPGIKWLAQSLISGIGGSWLGLILFIWVLVESFTEDDL